MASAGDRTALLKYQCLAADKWSRYPATQDVNMDCNSIKNLQSETFCDGTYIGPGSSFDISSGQNIVISTSGTNKSVTVESGFTGSYPSSNYGDGAKIAVDIDVSDGEIVLATQHPSADRQRGTMIKMSKRADVASQIIASADSIPLLEVFNSAMIQTEDRTVVMNSTGPIRLDFSRDMEPTIGPGAPAVFEYTPEDGRLQTNAPIFAVGGQIEGVTITPDCKITTIGYPLQIDTTGQEIHVYADVVVAGGTPSATGNYLRIKINGTYYKIALLSDS